MSKPIIRHCMNCEWHEKGFHSLKCTVKYEPIVSPRMEAVFCRYYKQRQATEEESGINE